MSLRPLLVAGREECSTNDVEISKSVNDLFGVAMGGLQSPVSTIDEYQRSRSEQGRTL